MPDLSQHLPNVLSVNFQDLNLGPIYLRKILGFNINVKLVLSSFKLTSVQISKYIWRDFDFETIFAHID